MNAEVLNITMPKLSCLLLSLFSLFTFIAVVYMCLYNFVAKQTIWNGPEQHALWQQRNCHSWPQIRLSDKCVSSWTNFLSIKEKPSLTGISAQNCLKKI